MIEIVMCVLPIIVMPAHSDAACRDERPAANCKRWGGVPRRGGAEPHVVGDKSETIEIL